MRPTALVLFILLAVGCGGDEGDEPPPPQTAPRAAPGQPAPDTTVDDDGAAGVAGGEQARGGEQAAAGAGEAQSPSPRRRSGADASAGDRLYTVQVAAFVDAATATEWTGRLRRQGMPVWTSVAEVGGQTFHRVRVGAAPSVTQARRLGAMITHRYEWPVWVTALTPADRPPANATQETRRLLESG